MEVGLDHEVREAADEVPEDHQALGEERGRVGLAVRLDRAHDLTGQPVEGRFAHGSRPAGGRLEDSEHGGRRLGPWALLVRDVVEPAEQTEPPVVFGLRQGAALDRVAETLDPVVAEQGRRAHAPCGSPSKPRL